MKIQMKQQISGTRNGDRWPAPGETLDVPADEADALIAQGYAVKPESKGEKATAPPKGEKRTTKQDD